jgi:7,8-dihydroneopterin aldolase/epimerase/oxygenase
LVQEISLHAMRFHALVGILPHERAIAQPIEIDLIVRVVTGEAIIDYRGLYDLTAAVLATGPIDFLEEIADRVVRNALAYNDRVQWARAAVRKPHVAMPGPVAYAQVVIERDAGA